MWAPFLFMDYTLRQQLTDDFELYMRKFYAQHKRFSLEDFGTFAATLLNLYGHNQILKIDQRLEAAYFLTTLYNKGIGNRIIEEHLQSIAKMLHDDTTVDFQVMQIMFS